MTKTITIDGASIVVEQIDGRWFSDPNDAIAFNERKANTDAYLKRLGMAVTKVLPGDIHTIGIPDDCPVPHGLRR